MGNCYIKNTKKQSAVYQNTKKSNNISSYAYDPRASLTRAKNYPYCFFGLIRTHSIRNGTGTGCMVGSNLVLTAASVVNFSAKFGKKLDNVVADQIEFIPAYSGYDPDLYPYGICKVKAVYVPNSYFDDYKKAKTPHDWALLLLEDHVGNEIEKDCKHPWLKARIFTIDELEHNKTIFSGYTPDHEIPNVLSEYSILLRYKDTFIQLDKNEGLFSYKVPSTPGQVGGGIITEYNNQRWISGIHQCVDITVKSPHKTEAKKCWGTKITKDIVKAIETMNEYHLEEVSKLYDNDNNEKIEIELKDMNDVKLYMTELLEITQQYFYFLIFYKLLYTVKSYMMLIK